MKRGTSKGTTSSDWKILEERAFDLLSLIPGAQVARETMISGKKVDLVAHFDLPLTFRVRAAVECKAFSRPLERKEVVSILTDYKFVLDSPEVNCLFIITNHGISVSASTLVDRKTVFHYRIDELSVLVIGTGHLVYNMIEQFHSDGLSDEFVEPTVKDNSASSEPVSLWKLVQAWIRDKQSTRHLAILGSYGLGKSSFARFVANRQALLHQMDVSERIPLLLKLREFSSHTSIESFVSSELATFHNATNPSFVRFTALNRMGRFLIILDGFDEMRSRATLFEIKFCFEELAKLYVPQSKVLVLGRPSLFSDDDELSEVIGGRFETVSGIHLPKHTMIRMAPMTTNQVVELVTKRGSRVLKYGDRGYERYEELRRRLSDAVPDSSYELKALLQRPVHVQMLLSILSSWEGDLLGIDRCKLYERFITLAVQREIARIPKNVGLHLTAEHRIQFSGQLAIQMLERGGAMSIAVRDIPNRIITSFFRDPHESLDAVRRDLLLGSFLELSNTGALHFAHKSYGEYLAAREVCRLLSKPKEVQLPSEKVFTNEVCSFGREMVDASDVPYIDVCATEGDLRTTRELRRGLASFLAVESLDEYWNGRVSEGRSVLAAHAILHYKKKLPLRKICSGLLVGIERGTSQFRREVAFLICSGAYGGSSAVKAFQTLLKVGDDEIIDVCLKAFPFGGELESVVQILDDRLEVAQSGNDLKTARAILLHLQHLSGADLLRIKESTHGKVILERIKGLERGDHDGVRQAAIALLKRIADS